MSQQPYNYQGSQFPYAQPRITSSTSATGQGYTSSYQGSSQVQSSFQQSQTNIKTSEVKGPTRITLTTSPTTPISQATTTKTLVESTNYAPAQSQQFGASSYVQPFSSSKTYTSTQPPHFVSTSTAHTTTQPYASVGHSSTFPPQYSLTQTSGSFQSSQIGTASRTVGAPTIVDVRVGEPVMVGTREGTKSVVGTRELPSKVTSETVTTGQSRIISETESRHQRNTVDKTMRRSTPDIQKVSREKSSKS